MFVLICCAEFRFFSLSHPTRVFVEHITARLTRYIIPVKFFLETRVHFLLNVQRTYQISITA